MTQLTATITLLAILAGVVKMVWDVQTVKLPRFIEDLKNRFDEN